MSGKLTTKSVDHCPACGSDNIWTDDTASTLQETRLDMRCMKCEAAWVIIHKYAEIQWGPKQ